MKLSTLSSGRVYAFSILGIMLCASALAHTAHAQAYGSGSFSTSLTGTNEVPAVSAGTIGDASVSFSGSTISYSVNIFGGDEITAAHLHCGYAGTNGPVVVTLFHDANGIDVNGALASGTIDDGDIESTASGCFPVINSVADLREAIDNGYIYVNAHSIQYPSGVARGQLTGNGDYSDDDSSDDRYDDDYTDEYGGHQEDTYGYDSSKDRGNGRKDRDTSQRYRDSQYDRENKGKSHDDSYRRDDRKDADSRKYEKKNDYSYGRKNDEHSYDEKNDYGDRGSNDGKNSEGKDGNSSYGSEGRSRGGSSAVSSVRSLVSANSNIRLHLR